MMPSKVFITLEHNLFIQLMENVSPTMININYQDIPALNASEQAITDRCGITAN